MPLKADEYMVFSTLIRLVPDNEARFISHLLTGDEYLSFTLDSLNAELCGLLSMCLARYGTMIIPKRRGCLW